jgi:hypothetical protein
MCYLWNITGHLFCAFIQILHHTNSGNLPYESPPLPTVPICTHTYFRGFNTMLVEPGHILCQVLLMYNFLNSMI